MPLETPAVACAHRSARSSFAMSCDKDEEADVYRYTVTLRLHCAQCGAPMQFLGLPKGGSKEGPRTSADGREARLPVEIATAHLLRCPDCGKMLVGAPEGAELVECGPVHTVKAGGDRYCIMPDGSLSLDDEEPTAGDLTIARQKAQASLEGRIDPDEAAARIRAAFPPPTPGKDGDR